MPNSLRHQLLIFSLTVIILKAKCETALFDKILDNELSQGINTYNSIAQVPTQLNCLMYCVKELGCEAATYDKQNFNCSLFSLQLQFNLSSLITSYNKILYIKKGKFSKSRKHNEHLAIDSMNSSELLKLVSQSKAY